jgi:hypothetical protein
LILAKAATQGADGTIEGKVPFAFEEMVKMERGRSLVVVPISIQLSLWREAVAGKTTSVSYRRFRRF